MADKDTMLVSKAHYLTAGIHIGMKSCTPYMKQFVYKVREDGLAVFNLQLVDQRIALVASFLAGFQKPLIVSRKEAAAQAITAFTKAIGGKSIVGRFAPGTLTNPSFKDFYEPDVVIVVDPLTDEQAVKEAVKKRVPLVSLVDTFNVVRGLDLVIPANNNGKRSIALIFWVLAREILKKRGTIKKDDEFAFTIQDFGGDDVKEAASDDEIIKELEKQEEEVAA